MLRADKIGLNLGKPLTSGLCISDDPYMVRCCKPCGERLFYKFSQIDFMIPFKKETSLSSWFNSKLSSFPGLASSFLNLSISDNFLNLSPRTGKHLKGTLSTSLRDHMLDCNNAVAWDDFKVLRQ